MALLEADPLLRLRHLARPYEGRRSATALPGGLVTRARGRGLETADLRAFAIGDDPRHIDRNATARLGRPQVRTFHAERDRTLLLVADFRPSMLWGTRRTFRSVAAAEALVLAGWQAVAAGARVGLVAVSAGEPAFVRPQGRDRAMIAAIGALVRAHAAALSGPLEADPPLSDALGLAERLSPRGAEVLLATGMDALGEGFDAVAHQLMSRRSLTVVRVLDAFEAAPPPGIYGFLTPEGRSGRARIAGAAAQGAPDAVPDGALLRTVVAAESPEDWVVHA